MMLVDKIENPDSNWEFESEVTILHHATTIKANY
jgi:GTPase